MSGHSKWSTIKHQKEATDKKRGKAFSKIGRAISIAAKEGKSGDPATNPRLRLVMEQARAVNMPKTNIERAIEHGLGTGGGLELQTVIYEGFAPENVAVIVECVTDNKNRTSAEIKSFFEKNGGNMGAPGSVAYLFQKKGKIIVQKTDNLEQQTLNLIDYGAEDIIEEGDMLTVYSLPDQLEIVKNKIEAAGFKITEACLSFKPNSLIILEENSTKEKIKTFIKNLLNFEDVQQIYSNVQL